MRWFRRVLWAVAALSLLCVAGWFGLQRALGPRVFALAPARREVVQTVVASGRVLSPGEVNVGSTLGGVVRAVHVREGDRVARGQLLLEFDDEELAAQVAQARAGVLLAAARVAQLRSVSARVAGQSLRQARTNLEGALTTFARQQSLFRSGALAEADLETAQRAVDLARSAAQSAELTAAGSRDGGGDAQVTVAGRVQAEAALRIALARLALARLEAPVDGVVLRRSVEPGDVVTPARALLVLLREGATEVSITPDERNLAQLRLGQRALVSAEAFPASPFPAEVSYLAPAIDALRGTVEVRLRVPSPPPYLRPAMTVSVEVEVARGANALVLPPDAVRDAATPTPWVLVVDATGRARRRDVRLGLHGARVVELASGLGDGEAVLSSTDAPSVRPGQAVRVQRGPGARIW